MRLTRPLLLSITALSFSLTGCQTLDAYTGESKTSNAVKYGAGAAVVCGLIGAIESGKRARNAGVGCGAIGAGVGAYMDHQEKVLRDELEGTGVRVQRDGDHVKLIMPGNITFDTNKSDVRADFYPVLDSVGKVLAKYVDTSLSVAGHTDSTGSASINQQLSDRRADSVAAYLRSRGVDYSRISAQGYGASRPIASNSNEAGRAQNRRVELDISARQH